jgi:cysteinyl-tRNA synthetase
MNAFIFDVLGLEAEKTANNSNDKLEAVVNMLIGMRNQARADKNFKLSDQIRDQLIAYGIQLKDGKEVPLVFKNLFLVISQEAQLLII